MQIVSAVLCGMWKSFAFYSLQEVSLGLCRKEHTYKLAGREEEAAMMIGQHKCGPPCSSLTLPGHFLLEGVRS